MINRAKVENAMSILEGLMNRQPVLKPCEKDIQSTFEYMQTAFLNRHKMLICGNGGSAADAEHWSGELLKGFVKPRPVEGDDRERLGPGLAAQLQRALPVIPLTSFMSLGTAYANDCNPQHVFAQLTYALGEPGDVLVGISTSGNAENVCLALRTAKAMGMTTIGLTGESGGHMKPFCDCCIRVPETETYLIQELHLPIYHALCIMLENALF